MSKQPSPQELERIAQQIALGQLTHRKQVAFISNQLRTAVRDIEAAKAELEEAQTRLKEIDGYIEDVQREFAEVDAGPIDGATCERKHEEYCELLEERRDELSLIAQLQRVLSLRVSVASHLRRVQVHLLHELARSKQKERLLAVLALRSGLMKLLPRKLQ